MVAPARPPASTVLVDLRAGGGKFAFPESQALGQPRRRT